MDAQRAVAQAGAGHRLPRTLDGELLDLLAHPVEAGACADFEIHARGFHHASGVRVRELDDVERGVVRIEARHTRRKLGRRAGVDVFLAHLLEAIPVRADEHVPDLRLELAHAATELRDRLIDVQLAPPM